MYILCPGYSISLEDPATGVGSLLPPMHVNSKTYEHCPHVHWRCHLLQCHCLHLVVQQSHGPPGTYQCSTPRPGMSPVELADKTKAGCSHIGNGPGIVKWVAISCKALVFQISWLQTQIGNWPRWLPSRQELLIPNPNSLLCEHFWHTCQRVLKRSIRKEECFSCHRIWEIAEYLT